MNRSFRTFNAGFQAEWTRADMVGSEVSGNERRRHICAGIILAESVTMRHQAVALSQKKVSSATGARRVATVCVSESIRLVRSECDRHSQVTADSRQVHN